MRRITSAEWGADEYRAVIAALMCGTQDRGPELGLLEARLRAIYGHRRLLFANRGRHALELALRVFAEARPGRTEVIFPAYICPSVIEAIEHAGLTPVAADILDDLNLDAGAVRSRLSSRSLAVIVAHMYGRPAPVAEIAEICREADVPLIDDAAQLAGRSVEGRPAGTFGACGLVSFSLAKTIVAGSSNAGAFIIVNEPELAANLQRWFDALPEARYSWRDLGRFAVDGPFYGELATVRYRFSQMRRRVVPGADEPVARSWEPRRMANANAAVALHQFASAEARVKGRIRVAAVFAQELAKYGDFRLPQFSPGIYLTRIMVSLPRETHVGEVRHRLRRMKIESRFAYPVSGPHGAGMRRALAASQQLIELPSWSGMKADTIAEIAAALDTACRGAHVRPVARQARFRKHA